MSLDLTQKKLLRKAPAETLDKLLSTVNDAQLRSTLSDLGDDLQRYLALEQSLLTEKKRISRQIGETKKQGADIAPLLSEMQSLTAKVNQTKDDLESTLEKIKVGVESSTKESAATQSATSDFTMPLHFRPQESTQLSNKEAAVVVEVAAPEEWNNYIAQHPAATIYHSLKWRKLIKSNFKHKSYYLAAKDSEQQICGVLPLVFLKSRLFGRFLVSMPYFNYGGPLADSPMIAEQLLNESSKIAESLQCSHTEIRENHPRAGWPARTEKVSMTLAFPASATLLHKMFGAKLRSQIKRPEQYDASIAFGSHELLDGFYSVFSRRMRSLGTPVYSKKFFADILSTYPESATIALVSVGEKPVAAGFLLGYGDTMEIPWAASVENDKYPCINMFLYGKVLDRAQSLGFAFFDFGRSTIDGATYKFKKQWGAEPQTLHWHYWLRDGSEPPAINPSNPKYQLVIKVWRCLPLKLTQLIGPLIVRNLP